MMSDEINLTEAEPGQWMTHSQARTHRIVQRQLANSDFIKRKWRLGKAIDRLPRTARLVIFLLYISAAVWLFLVPLRVIGNWLFYS